MKINTKTKELFTDTGVFIKKLNCKYNVEEKELKTNSNPLTIGDCSLCKRVIYKTENLTDLQILQLVQKDPNTCLYIDLEQNNVSITTQKSIYFHELMGVSLLKCKNCDYKTEEFTLNTRFMSAEPHQCQECGIISETSQAICNHVNSLSKRAPLFCMKCKSTSVNAVVKYIG